MDILIALGVLAGCWIAVALAGHGYANTIWRIELFLNRHRHATLRRQAARQKVLRQMWASDRRRKQRVEPIEMKREVG